MIRPRRVQLYLKPEDCDIEASIVSLSESMIDEKMKRAWWADEALDTTAFDPMPIDRFWDWNCLEIDRDGIVLASEKIAVVAGDDEHVEGAMMISTQPVDCVREFGKHALFVELLFTAPRR